MFLHIVLSFTFFLDKKGNQKIKANLIAPRILPGQRRPIAEGAALLLGGTVGLTWCCLLFDRYLMNRLLAFGLTL